MFSKKLISMVLAVSIVTAILVVPSASAGGSTNASFGVAANNGQAAYINMYRIDSLGRNNYSGYLASTQYTSGSQVRFTVPLGAMVNFIAFSDYQSARSATRWTFNSPPYKNFTMQDAWAGKLCQINFQDSSTKMMSNGRESCAWGGMSVAVNNNNYVTPGSSARVMMKFSVQRTNDPSTGVSYATIEVTDQYGARIANLSSGSTGVASYMVEQGKLFTFKAYKDGVTYAVPSGLHYVSGNQLIRQGGTSKTYVLQLNAYPTGVQNVVFNPVPLPSSLTITNVATEGAITVSSPTVAVRYTLSRASTVTVTVMNGNGRVVRTLDSNTYRYAGTNRAVWDGRNYAGTQESNGWYQVQIRAGSVYATSYVQVNRAFVSSTAPVTIDTDCDMVNPNSVTVEWNAAAGKYTLVSHGTNVTSSGRFAFQTFPTYSEAVKAKEVIQGRQLNQLCFVGRGTSAVNSYWLGGTRTPAVLQEDCTWFNPKNISLVSEGNGKYTLKDGSHAIETSSNYQKALQLRSTLQQHNFSQSCFVGRPNPSMHYYK